MTHRGGGTQVHSTTHAESSKRAKEKEDLDRFNRQKEEFAYYIQKKYKTSQWKPLVDPDTGKKIPPPKQQKGQPMISNVVTTLGLIKDGIYQHPDFKGMDLIVSNGSIKPKEPIKSDADMVRFANAAVHMGSTGLGTKSITVDWPSDKYVTQKKLDAFLEAAQEKDPVTGKPNGKYKVAIVWGPNVNKFLQSKRNDDVTWTRDWRLNQEKQLSPEDAFARQKKYENASKQSQADVAAAEKSEDYKKFSSVFKLRAYKKDFDAQTKLSGTPQANAAAVKKDMFGELGATPTRTEKLDAMERHFDDFERRSQALKTGNREAIAIADNILTGLRGDQASVTAAKDKARATNAPEKAYISSAKKEFGDLMERKRILKAELKVIGDYYKNKGKANLTPDEREERKRVKHMREQLASLDKASPKAVEQKAKRVPNAITAANNRLARPPAPNRPVNG